LSPSFTTGCGPAGCVLVGGWDGALVYVRRLVEVGDDAVVRGVVVVGRVVVVVGSEDQVDVAVVWPPLAVVRERPAWLSPIAAMPTRTTPTSTTAIRQPCEDRGGGGWPCQALCGGGITGATTGGRAQFT
jgi:hypothetical protein